MTARAPNLSITAVGLGVLILVGGALWFGVGATSPPPARSVALPVIVDPESTVTVHVSGAVLDPGVVQVAPGSRVMDVIVAAGGAIHSADLTQVNLASTVRDGERVVVPFEGVVGATPAIGSGVDLNSATAAGLEELPGVGPVLAARIVAYREERGPFEAVEDLLDVPGIGEAKLAGMRDAIATP